MKINPLERHDTFGNGGFYEEETIRLRNGKGESASVSKKVSEVSSL